MDLNIKDVAELIQVSEPTIRQYLDDGQIPGYCIKGQWRFSRQEIEAWVITRKKEGSDSESTASRGNLRYSLYRALNQGGVIGPVAGVTKEEVIREATNLIAKKLQLDGDVLSEFLLDREKLMPTSLNHGLAIPHARDFLLEGHQDVVAVVYPEEPIDYDALDGEPVHTLFFLFASEDKHHLNLLAKIAHLANRPHIRQMLQGRPSTQELLATVKAWEGQVP